jgi:hypothetical protein
MVPEHCSKGIDTSLQLPHSIVSTSRPSNSSMSKPRHNEPDLWKEAYQALYEDDEEKGQMQKLQTKLRKRLNDPTLDLGSELGYKKMISFINVAGDKIATKKHPERFSKVCQHMLQIKELVGAGVAVGGPYAAIPAAALFLVFSVCDAS